jgi:glycosyltransferase involved in cell wall biosynthesis
LRVLHVAPSFYPAFVYGGPTRSVYQLCLSLASAGCDVKVLTTNANGPEAVLNVATDREIEIAERLHVRYCHRIMDVSVSPMLLRYLIPYVQRADVVHLMAVYSFPTIPVLLAARICGKPVVWSPRGMLQRWSGSSRPLLKSLWEQVCCLVSPSQLILHVTSDAEAAESLQRLPGVQTAIVPNGVDIPESISHVHGDSQLRIAYIGRLDPKKGIENLLAACGIVDRNSGLDYSLKIAGAGAAPYIDSLKKQIEASNLTERIVMLGNVEGQAKRDLFANADVVVIPSHTENFGLVVAEALAHGVPVIASRGTPWRRMEEVGCGLWVDNTAEALASALMAVQAMPLREMGERGRVWMQREFTWARVGEQMLNLYYQLGHGDRMVPLKKPMESTITEDA